MEPVLSSGDRIMVDTSQRVPVLPGIFVICDGMGIVAKRIEHILSSDPAKLRIMSVNPDYETYERDAEEVHVIGRVVWSATAALKGWPECPRGRRRPEADLSLTVPLFWL